MTGVMMRTWIVDVTMPPMIGPAMGFITSEPTPWLHMIGISDAMTTVTVISFGRSRRTEPEIVASQMSRSIFGRAGGIRTHQEPVDSVSYRFHNAAVAANAGAAVAPCPLLPARPGLEVDAATAPLWSLFCLALSKIEA